MRDWEKRAGFIVIGGLAVAAIGVALRLKHLGPAGLALLGAGVVCWGLSGVLEGRISFSRPGSRYTASYYGLAARAWGVLLWLAGAAIIGAALLLLIEPDVSFAEIVASPFAESFGMLFGGLAGMLYAVTLISGRAEDAGSLMRRTLSLPRRLLGVFVLLASAILASTGVVRMAAPQTYEAVVRSITERLPRASY